jgi:hypothetical protein
VIRINGANGVAILREVVFDCGQGELGFEISDLASADAVKFLESKCSGPAVGAQIGRERLNSARKS